MVVSMNVCTDCTRRGGECFCTHGKDFEVSYEFHHLLICGMLNPYIKGYQSLIVLLPMTLEGVPSICIPYHPCLAETVLM